MKYAFAPKHAGIKVYMGLEDYAMTESIANRLMTLRQEAELPARLAAQLLSRRK
jgi:hypothetical protein